MAQIIVFANFELNFTYHLRLLLNRNEALASLQRVAEDNYMRN